MIRFRLTKTTFRLQREVVFFIISFIIAWLLALTLSGLLPGMATNMPANLSDLGAIQCGTQSLGALLRLHCMSIGGTAGAIVSIGSPFALAGALIVKFLPLSVEWAYSIVAAGIMFCSIAGAYGLFRAVRVSTYVALAGATLYVLLPIMLSMQSFGDTYWGVLLLPAYIYLVWRVLQELPHLLWRGRLCAFVLWTVLSGFALFMDGYSFFMYAFASAILLAAWSWGRWKVPMVWFAVASFFAANSLVYLLYRHLIPASTSWSDSIDLFRAMGLDIVTLFRPSSSLWWVRVFGIHISGAALWGDGSNSSSNYVGFVMLSMAIFGIYVSRKKLTRLSSALLIIGALAFILSLGPSLKVDATKPVNVGGPVSHSSYLMPANDALLTLPTTPFYKVVPGLKSMRATYRWHVLTMLALLAFAVIAVQSLVERKRIRLAYILMALVCLEMLPNPIDVIKAHVQVAQEIAAFNVDVLNPLSRYVLPGERIIYYPNAVGNNDFLVDYLTPSIQGWTYNIGGDKAQAIAYSQMPRPVFDLLTTDDDLATLNLSGKRMKVVLSEKLVDAIVVPTFDLRWNSYSWPPSARDTLTDPVLQSAYKEHLSVYSAKYFYVVKLK